TTRQAEPNAQLLKKGSMPVKGLRSSLLKVAALYRQSADKASGLAGAGFSSGSIGTAGAPIAQSYLVGNPHDREESVDLFIRRASLPPEWKVSIANAEPESSGRAQGHVEEVQAGQHYRVQLPANGQVTVMSVVVPVGIVGENTRARWADEGRIGEEH